MKTEERDWGVKISAQVIWFKSSADAEIYIKQLKKIGELVIYPKLIRGENEN